MVLSLQQVSKIYDTKAGPVAALTEVNLELAAGDFIAIMGPSGSGKSTMLNIMGCLDQPTSGTITLGGEEINTLPGHQLPEVRRRYIGYVFQHNNLIPTLTAAENVMLPLKYNRQFQGNKASLANTLLGKVGLGHRQHHLPGELSGGEQQRVAIARALVNNPAIILADEPTGAVDSKTARSIMELLKELNQEKGQTLVIVTHDPEVAGEAGRVYRMADGRLDFFR
ncbi:MAG: ABC transporter ATP-binding protein [Clostridia bacterium]|nr:ABC transporter ATP-binding protein [Clostridia bacterium]